MKKKLGHRQAQRQDHGKHRRTVAICKARDETSEETNPAGNQLLASRIVRK